LIKIIGNRNCIKRKFLYPFISKIFLIFVLLVFFCSINQSCKKRRRWSKEWEEAFESFQPTNKILDTIGVKSNMVIGEVGAGNGRVAVKAAAIVGENGRVYANDIDDKTIKFMKNRCKIENIDIFHVKKEI
jgi:SAM-dependent methyltransferase